MFVYSLPIVLFDLALVSVNEFVVSMLVLIAFLWLTAPQPLRLADQLPAENARQHLAQAWLGQKPFWLVFWPFYLLLNGVLWYVDGLAMRGEFTVSSWDALHFVFFTPIIFWGICVWRNSVNCSWRFWSAMARFLVIATCFEYGLKLFLRLQHPRLYFNCEDAVLNYFVCF